MTKWPVCIEALLALGLMFLTSADKLKLQPNIARPSGLICLTTTAQSQRLHGKQHPSTSHVISVANPS